MVEDLYAVKGIYSFSGGINWRAVVAVGVGISINVPGFLAQASGGSIAVPTFFSNLYTYAWFISLALSGLVYLALGLFSPPSTKEVAS